MIPVFAKNLREEDVSMKMYKETLRTTSNHKNIQGQSSVPKPESRASKVNMICAAFLEALRERTSTHLQNIITAHVCKNPPDLEAGLTEISKLQSMLPHSVILNES